VADRIEKLDVQPEGLCLFCLTFPANGIDLHNVAVETGRTKGIGGIELMKIEILYFDKCPNRGPTVARVKEALRQEDLNAELVEIHVSNEATARSLRFIGSPTVLIDGVDIEVAARFSKDSA
jgi:hypothetical protein